VLFGRNGEDLWMLYQPFIEVLRQSPASVTGTSAVLSSAMAPLMPDSGIADGESAQNRDPAVDSETRRHHMFEAVADWHDSEQNRSTPTLRA
jgi:hypothetical protein